MHFTPVSFRRMAWALTGLLTGLLTSTPLLARPTNLEMVALVSGRIVGAARACSINPDRIRNASDRILSLVNDKAASVAEKAAATRQFINAQTDGGEDIRSARSRCTGVHVQFSEIEVKLGRAPGSAVNAVVAKRGVPLLGSLHTEISVETLQP